MPTTNDICVYFLKVDCLLMRSDPPSSMCQDFVFWRYYPLNLESRWE